MPFAGYPDFQACVRDNQDKDDPEAFCAYLESVAKDSAGERPRSKVELVQSGVMRMELAATEVPDGWQHVGFDLAGRPLFATTSTNVTVRSAADSKAQAEPGGGELPEAYRPASSDDVPEGRACGNCAFYDEDQLREADDGALEVWCSHWATFVRGDHYCDAWRADEAEETTEEMEGATAAVEAADGQIEASPVNFRALIMVEGMETGDGRVYNSITWREPPLPFMALDTTTEAHLEARLVGNFDRFWKEGAEVWGEGHFVNSEDPDIVRLQTLIRSGELRGVSADMDDLEVEFVFPADAIEPEETPTPNDAGELVVKMEQPLVRVTEARLMGATAVPFPAFALGKQIDPVTASGGRPVTGRLAEDFIVASSYDDIDFAPPEGARTEAEKGLEWRREHGRGGTEVGIARARDIANGRNLSPDTVRRMASFFARHETNKGREGWSPGEDGYPSNARIAWALWGGDPGKRWADSLVDRMNSRDEQGGLTPVTASIEAPLAPPAAWFGNPGLRSGTPLTVTDEGQVFGHLALWDSCHIGFDDRCVQPPRSATSYAHFRTGEIACDDGSRVAVGQITMDTGHAPLNANAARAAAHYDHTGWVVADVATGEDDHGIWMAGALRPDVDPGAVRRFMAADVSGDWRRIGNALELVAILSVNVGGFPKLRMRNEEGIVASLVASLPTCANDDPDADPKVVRAVAERIAATIGRDTPTRLAELRRRVHGGE